MKTTCTTDTADRMATRLSDSDVRLLASVSLGLSSGKVPELSYAEWCAAEALFDAIEAEEDAS